jgi:hypothetical protein
MRERGSLRRACGGRDPPMLLFLNESVLPIRHIEKVELGFG